MYFYRFGLNKAMQQNFLADWGQFSDVAVLAALFLISKDHCV